MFAKGSVKCTIFWFEDLMGRGQSADTGTGGRIILEWFLWK
jgi:hypothetical protein